MKRWPVSANLNRLVRSAGFRFALLHTAAFVIAVAALGVLVELAVTSALREQVRLRTDAEIAALVDEFDHGGRIDLVVALKGRLARDGERVSHAVIETDGRVLVGERWLEAFAGSGDMPACVVSGVSGRTFDKTVIAAARGLGDGSTLVVVDNLESVADVTAILNRAYLSALALAVILGIALAILLTRQLLARVETVNRAAEAIIAGDLGRRIAVNGSADEFDRLAVTLNCMLDRIAGLIENLRQVTNDIAHDLRTPLTRLRQGLVAARRIDDPTRANDRAVAEIDEILDIFTALLRIAQIEAGARRAAFRSIDLSDVLRTVADAFAPAIEDSGRTLSLELEPGMRLEGDRELLIQLFANLIENALRHTPGGTAISVVLTRSAEGLRATVADDGPGIASEERQNVLRRFYQVEKSRSLGGHGLGLSLVAAVAELHRARLLLEDGKPGLRVIVAFPRELAEFRPSARSTDRTAARLLSAPRRSS